MGEELGQTSRLWANVLKRVRESGDEILLSILSNLFVTYTTEAIILTAPNKGIYEILEKNRDKLGCDLIQIKLKKPDDKDLTTEQKLVNLFGEKLELL